MSMTSQAWAVIGIGVGIIALGIAGFGLMWNAINALSIRIDAQSADFGARINALSADVGSRLDSQTARIDGIEHELQGINRTLGQLLGMAHVHEHNPAA